MNNEKTLTLNTTTRPNGLHGLQGKREIKTFTN